MPRPEPETGATVSARGALRAATAEAHERLHHLRPFVALAEGRITYPGYTALLRRLLGFHLAVEASLVAAPSLDGFGLALPERRRTGLLRQDLVALGVTPLGVSVAPLPPLPDRGQAMGRLYVTEGSTLGGRMLARGLDGLLGAGTSGRAFLMGHGARHAAMWQGFCLALERCGADPAHRAAMLAGAASSFAAFEDWFSAPGWMPDSGQA